MLGLFQTKNYNFSTSENLAPLTRYNINGFDILYFTLDSQYNDSPIVNRVVSVIADCIANLPPLIIDESSRSLIKDHPFWDILKAPNHEQIWTEFIRDTVSDYLLNGNSYTYLGTEPNGEINHTRRVRSANVNVTINSISGDPLYYDVQGYNGNSTKVRYYPYFNPRAKLLKWSQYDSKSMFCGDESTSKLQSATDEIKHVELASKYNLSFLRKGARPSFALVIDSENGYDGQLSKGQRDALREELTKKIGGSDNAGEIMILEGGMELKQLSTNIKDMDFKDLMELSMSMICMVLGVPPEMCGITKAKTYNSAEEARIAFFDSTVIPMANLLYGKLNSWIMYRYAANRPNTKRYKNSILTYDKASIDSLEKRRLEIHKSAKETGALTINDRRRRQHLDEVENGDDVILSTGEMPHTMVTLNAKDKNNQSDGGSDES